MKFLYFGDLHERPTSPENRLDDYRETVNQKIQEIRELGMKHKVKAFLQPGDFLDKPKFDAAFLSEVISRWGFADIQEDLLGLATGEVQIQEISTKLQNYIPIIGAIGNHELYGNALKSYPKTSLAFLEKIGFIHLPSKERPFIFKDETGFTVAITASHYDTHMDDPDHIDEYIVEKKAGDYHIHIVHGFLTDKNMGDLFPHTTVDDIAKKTQADLTITGHDHIGFNLVEVDGKKFVNPGAVIRVKNDVKEIKRRPKVLLIDIEKDKGISVKNIYLKSAPKGEQVLDRSHKVFQQSMSAKLEQIKSLVNKSNVGSGLSITDIIQAISESEHLDESLKNRAIDAVTEKMNEIQKPTVMAQDYFIEKIVLENFQSHERSEYELKQGLNVFIGKSSSGKSAVQRALAWVYENDGRDPRRYIKNGSLYTRVSLYLSNGFVISRLVEKKKNGKNGYEIFNPMDGTTTFYNTKSLPLIQEYLGFTYLQIDDKRMIPLNFQKQGMSWFFIGDGFTNTDRAKIIGSVYQTHYVDAVIKDLEGSIKKNASRMKDQKKEIDKLEEEMAKFNHLPQLEQTIQEVEKRLVSLQEKQQQLEKAKKLLHELTSIEAQIKLDEALIQSLQQIPLAEQKLEGLMKKVAQQEQVIRLTEDLGRCVFEIHKERNILQNLQNIETAENRYQELLKKAEQYQELHKKWERAVALEKEQSELREKMEECQRIIQSYQSLPLMERKVQDLEQKIERVQKGKELMLELKEITKSGISERKTVEDILKENRLLVEKYQTLLKDIGTCPVCQSKIDQETIEQISESYLMTTEKERMKHVS